MLTCAPPRPQYRTILRRVRELPAESVAYYRAIAREARFEARSANPEAPPAAFAPPAALTRCAAAAQKFAAHRDESDPERVRVILERSAADVAWVLNKYGRK